MKTAKSENSVNVAYHVLHKLPPGDSPYVRGKHLQIHDITQLTSCAKVVSKCKKMKPKKNKGAGYVENQQHNIAYVNIKFTRIDYFEFTRECAIFDLLDIPLYHGWIVDPHGCFFRHLIDACSQLRSEDIQQKPVISGLEFI